jgi:hypothetical protein
LVSGPEIILGKLRSADLRPTILWVKRRGVALKVTLRSLPRIMGRACADFHEFVVSQ